MEAVETKSNEKTPSPDNKVGIETLLKEPEQEMV